MKMVDMMESVLECVTKLNSCAERLKNLAPILMHLENMEFYKTNKDAVNCSNLVDHAPLPEQ